MASYLVANQDIVYIVTSIALFLFFFLNNRAPPEISPLPLHDALPIFREDRADRRRGPRASVRPPCPREVPGRCSVADGSLGRERVGPDRAPVHEPLQRLEGARRRSEEHTSELQSQSNLVCRLLLEKKK